MLLRVMEVMFYLYSVSQTQGSESILAQGQSVVGWYHSHPTFAPNPSIRDMETQEKFQVTDNIFYPFKQFVCLANLVYNED